VRARRGKYIAFDIKEFNKADSNGYLLTVENRKSVTGRYADSLILTTDSRVKPTITVPVYGRIFSTKPTPKSAPRTLSGKKTIEE